MKKSYRVSLNGCDDSTYIDIELDEIELKIVSLLCEKSKEEFNYICMPIMEIRGL